MKGFILGLLVAGIAVAVYWHGFHKPAPSPVAKVDTEAPSAPSKKKRRGRGAARTAHVASADEASASDPEPVRLSASDLRTVAQGDDVSTPDVLKFDMSNDKELTELTQDQIDDRFRAREAAILSCISRSRPDPETYVPGRVTIKFRIQRAGTVRGVRVEAPAILQRGGLYSCVKGVVMGLRFPAAQTSQIVSYPFSLS